MDEFKVEFDVGVEYEAIALCAKEPPEKHAVPVKEKTCIEQKEETERSEMKTETVFIKEEPQWEDIKLGPNETPQRDMYAVQYIKQEIIIEIESLQPEDAFVTPSKQEVDESQLEKPDTQVNTIARTTQKQSRNEDDIALENAKYVCAICNEIFSMEEKLISHTHSHKTGKTFSNATCDKLHRSDLAHRQNKKQYRCKYCQKELLSSSSLIKHEKHTICNLCSIGFVCVSFLAEHRRTHKLMTHTCNVCERQFKQKAHLKTHELIHEGESAKQYPCQYCSKKYAIRYQLVIHERVHTGDRPFACRLCDKSYTQKYQLDSHMTVHTGHKPFICDTCKKSFRFKHDLQTHVRTHLGIKPFRCGVCGKHFSQKTHLKSHKSIHTGEKSFLCDMCKKWFSTKRSLVKHIQSIHFTVKKVYSCDQCQKQFERASSLALHIKSHARRALKQEQCPKKFVCKVCNKEFGSKFNMDRHATIHTVKRKTTQQLRSGGSLCTI